MKAKNVVQKVENVSVLTKKEHEKVNTLVLKVETHFALRNKHKTKDNKGKGGLM